MTGDAHPMISVVTASYNYKAFLSAALDGVARQDYPHIEHVVFDGQSTDGSVELLKEYGAAHPHLRWASEPDRGQSDALNKGFRAARGDIVGWLNADDYYLPGCFEQVASAFADRPDIDVVYGDFRWIDADGRVTQVRRELEFDPFLLKYLHILHIPTTATFFRRRVFEDGNFLDPEYHYSMDYEFFVRLAACGYRFRHMDAVVADFRWHDASKSSTEVRGFREEQARALLLHDPLLQSVPPALRRTTVGLLRLGARSKRYLLKAVQGKFIGQWPRSHARASDT